VGLRPGMLGDAPLLYRCAVEGVAFSLRQALAQLLATMPELKNARAAHFSGGGGGGGKDGTGGPAGGIAGSGGGSGAAAPPLSVRLVGGASASPLWRQVVADAMRLPVATLPCAESAALGAALQAAGHVAAVAAASATGAGAAEAAAFDLGAWIAAHHDPARMAGSGATATALPSEDPAVMAAYDAAFALYEDRARRLFAGGEP